MEENRMEKNLIADSELENVSGGEGVQYMFYKKGDRFFGTDDGRVQHIFYIWEVLEMCSSSASPEQCQYLCSRQNTEDGSYYNGTVTKSGEFLSKKVQL